MRWKVIEASTVTDDSLTAILNEWVAQGWTFEGMQFAMRESSKRPAMAFVLFTRREEAEAAAVDASAPAANVEAPAARPEAPTAPAEGDDGQR